MDDVFFFSEARESRERGREKEGREDVGEKEIKRGSLGGGAHEGEAFVCSYARFGRSG